MTLNTHQADRITGGGPPSDYVSPSRLFNVEWDYNTFENCPIGITVDSPNVNAILPLEGNRFINCAVRLGSNSLLASGLVGWEATRLGTKLIVYRPGATKPTAGLWAVGDECSFGTPLAGGPPGAVFTALGWKFQSSLEV